MFLYLLNYKGTEKMDYLIVEIFRVEIFRSRYFYFLFYCIFLAISCTSFSNDLLGINNFVLF